MINVHCLSGLSFSHSGSSTTNSKSGIPIELGSTHNSITITWEHPKTNKMGKGIDRYEIRYKKRNETKWNKREFTSDNRNTFTVKKLKSFTEYNFKVRALYEGDEDEEEIEGPFSDKSKSIATRQTLANTMMNDATKTNNFPQRDPKKELKGLTIWKLNLLKDKDKEIKTAKTRKVAFGKFMEITNILLQVPMRNPKQAKLTNIQFDWSPQNLIGIFMH